MRLSAFAVAFLILGSVGIGNCQTWTPLTHRAPVSMGAMLLLTDGRVLVHEEPNCSTFSTHHCVGNDYSVWYTLTPDKIPSERILPLQRRLPHNDRVGIELQSLSKGPEFPMSRCSNRCNASWKISTNQI